MNVLHALDQRERPETPLVLAIGFFDGVHLGHQRVIGLCRDKAREIGAQSWVMTFDPHPLHVVQPSAAPLLLTGLPAKVELLADLGVDGCLVMPFTPEFAEWSPEAFLEHLVHGAPGLREIVIGENWRFGRKASGDVQRLKDLAARHGFQVTVANPVRHGGHAVSSSRVREAVARGQLDEAARMLGRPHAVRGTVVKGAQRGRRLGFPTANLDLTGFALPPPGIYAARVRLDNRKYGGAVYLPAPPHGAPSGLLEVHLLDFSGDVYERELTVSLCAHLRDDNRRFTDEADLIRQIGEDIRAIRQVLETQS
ncbi:MAG TPA: bifunctional riboflavin kinase/FAD synthetase [Kiritimatiellia bacterium]|nr:bifunctional riboflavin kinase/FAD synthetase [Kiritimatiellia bacterium]HMO97544.1 bifunctional riboflavin kinase/FAD synthetase [Kiritimatiellia bacterium]HMP97018.1 bifunctional riboflavin kinase/FAD synthetase [Kiritimatiellia bacterium]